MKQPQKLQRGDEIRVIAPSRSRQILSAEGIEKAVARLEEMGFHVTFGEHVDACDMQGSSSIDERIVDLHAAFADTNVKGILTVIGGFNCNELLPYIDYELVANNPKVLCGFSDITALANAITAKCGFITYSGPHFSSFQMEGLQPYQTTHFEKCIMQAEPFTVAQSPQWSDDLWFLDEDNRNYAHGEWKTYTDGEAEGTLFGGNLCTFNLLQGTPYMPSIPDDAIFFIEDDEETKPETFARDLMSLLQALPNIKGLLIGRFQNVSQVTEDQLLFILQKHPLLREIPVMYGMDFGHTQPIATMPIGGRIYMNSTTKTLQLNVF